MKKLLLAAGRTAGSELSVGSTTTLFVFEIKKMCVVIRGLEAAHQTPAYFNKREFQHDGALLAPDFALPQK